MAYNKTVWQDDSSPYLNAANLNKMESGIEAANKIVPENTGTTGQVMTKTPTGTQWTDAGNPTDAQVADAVGDWLDDNITPTAPVVDSSLSITGAAADAKKTGDEISSLKSTISEYKAVLGVDEHNFFSTDGEVINGYINGSSTIVSNASNRIRWCKLLPNCKYNLSIANKANTDVTLILSDSVPVVGSVGIGYTQFVASATSVNYDFETDSTHIYLAMKYFATSASTYTETQVLNSIAVTLTDEATVYAQIDRLNELITKASDGYETFDLYGGFINGGMHNGVYDKNALYRVCSESVISTERELNIAIKSGYRLGVHYFENGAFASDSGWQTGEYTIPANKSYKILISKVTEDTSAIADVSEFVNAVPFNTLAIDMINDLDIPSADDSIIIPVLRNGSESNSGNADAVCMQYILPIQSIYDYLSVQFTGDTSVANAFIFMYTLFKNATDGMTTSEAITTSSVTKQRYNTDWNPISKPYIEFPIEDFGDYTHIAIAFAREMNGTRVPVRIATEPNCLKLQYGFYGSSESQGGSNDILHKVQNARHVKSNSGTSLTLLHFSDLHADKSALTRIMNGAEDLGAVIDDMICTGDMVENTATEIASWWDSRVMTCVGNHDSASYNSSTGYNWTALSMANRDAYYISPFKSNWGITHTSGRSYYYKDYSSAKVRLIVIDSMLYTDNGSEATAQTSWLEGLLASAITNNLHVLIATHAPHGDSTAIECSFSRYGQTAMPVQSDCTTPQIVIDTVATKISAGLHFIGYLVGHTHQDNIWDATGDGTQLMYCVTCAITKQEAWWKDSDMYRSNTLDAFNLVTIDTTNSLVKLVRGGGAEIDDHMRTRKAICIDYSTGRVVGEVL